MRLPLILIPLVLFLALLTGCGSAPKQYETRIDGASAHTSDHQSAKSTGNTTTTKITITPTTQPAEAPVIQRATIIAPATRPAAASIVNVAEVPAPPEPTPVHVEISGRKIDAPAGSAVTLEVEDVGTPSETHRDREAEGLGASIKTQSKDATAGFNASAPDAKLSPVSNLGQGGGGGSADGGDSDINLVTKLGQAISAASKGATAMWVIAILCFLAAIGVTLFDVFITKTFNFLLVGILAGIGILFVGLALVIEQHPTMLILGVLAAVGGFTFYVYHKNAVSTAAGTPKPATPAAVPAPTDVSMWQEIKTEIDAALSPKPKA